MWPHTWDTWTDHRINVNVYTHIHTTNSISSLYCHSLNFSISVYFADKKNIKKAV